jgi:hypothetical protein
MDELTLDGKIYISSKKAAQVTGYAKDYVGQLCREGRVAARLVGRNWYVLDSSIRKHRFGSEVTTKKDADSTEESENEIQDTWKASQYVSESTSELPILLAAPIKLELESGSQPEEVSINAFDRLPPAPTQAPVFMPSSSASPIVQEMQSAWHDWFSRTNELHVSEETLLESEEMIEEREKEPEIKPSEHFADEDVVPISIESFIDTPVEVKKASESFNPEEAVLIHRTYAAAPVVSTRKAEIEVKKPTDQQRHPSKEAVNGRIVRERVIRKRGKPSIALQALLLSVTVLVIVVAVLGSGQFDTFIGARLGDFQPLHYLAGQSSFNKVSK